MTKLFRIIGTTSVTKVEVEQSRVCEFLCSNDRRDKDDVREFFCSAPNKRSQWLSASKNEEGEIRFLIDEACLKTDQAQCFIWRDR